MMEQARKEFEEWCIENGYSTDLNRNGPSVVPYYQESDTRRCWYAWHDAWQAARALPVQDKDAEDARRYRWLRDPKNDVAEVIDKQTGENPRGLHDEFNGYAYEYRSGGELDAAIDAAMKEEKK